MFGTSEARHEWLEAAVRHLRPRFTRAGYGIPERRHRSLSGGQAAADLSQADHAAGQVRLRDLSVSGADDAGLA